MCVLSYVLISCVLLGNKYFFIVIVIVIVIVDWTLGNKLQRNLNWNLYIFIQENAFERIVCEMAAILSRPQCVKGIYCKVIPVQQVMSPLSAIKINFHKCKVCLWINNLMWWTCTCDVLVLYFSPHWFPGWVISNHLSGIILGMWLANERRRSRCTYV